MFGRSVQALCNARVIRGSAPINIMHKQYKLTTIRSASGVIPFKLADIGEGIAEVELLKWFVKVCILNSLVVGNVKLTLRLVTSPHRKEMLSRLSTDCAKFRVTRLQLRLLADMRVLLLKSIPRRVTL